ncbi:hypothetical protein Clacol_007276 [Clathrus columnatus]|uniref:Uncharacterized protein n=1 Tax=Clathrus columnatus TaxID=1419009 RepID=A0AAV5AH20_9AGAM|nr:hypothetical protein Clacol_007276 [Clathrus columnatus]
MADSHDPRIRIHEGIRAIKLFTRRLTDAHGAVLTTTVDRYFPLNHNTHPATQNGLLNFIGESNGLSSFVFVEPQDTALMATYIAGSSMVEVIVSVSTAIVSYSCDIGTTQATCLVANLDPKNSQVVSSSIIKDSIDPVALVEVGPPDVLTQAPSSSSNVVGPASTSTLPEEDKDDDNQGLLPVLGTGSAIKSTEALSKN